MESDPENPPIYPRIQDYVIQSASQHLVQENDSGQVKENQIYDKLPSRPRKHCISKGASFLICLIVLAFITGCIIAAILFSQDSGYRKNKMAGPHRNYSLTALMLKGDPIQAHEKFIEVVGSGDLIMNLFPGEEVHPWALKSKKNKSFLEFGKFLRLKSAGRYQIYCKVTFHGKPAKLELKLIRNGKPYLFGTFFGNVKKPSTYILREEHALQINDSLSVVPESRAALIMKDSTSILHLRRI